MSLSDPKVTNRERWRAHRRYLIAASFVLAAIVVSVAARLPAQVTESSFRPPPSTSGADLLGRQVSLGSMRGTPLVVIFFASWCGPCHEDAPIFTGLADRYGER